MKKSKGVAIIAIILACLIGLGYYTSTIMSATSTSQKKTDNKTEAEGIKLGLDLSGGVSITYRIKDRKIHASPAACTFVYTTSHENLVASQPPV